MFEILLSGKRKPKNDMKPKKSDKPLVDVLADSTVDDVLDNAEEILDNVEDLLESLSSQLMDSGKVNKNVVLLNFAP